MRDMPPKRPTLTLQRPLYPPVGMDAKTDFRPPRGSCAPRNGQQAKNVKSRTEPKQEWREHHASGPTTPILLDARDIGWLIEGGDKLAGKTIVGLRNAKEEPIILNHSFIEVCGWWKARVRRQMLELVLLGSARRMAITKDGLSCVRERDGVAVVLPRGKGAKSVPVDIPYALLKAWCEAGPEPKRRYGNDGRG